MTPSGIPDASADAHGLMSALDYAKLAGLSAANVSIGAFGSTPNAFGLSIIGQAISLEPADATRPGALSFGAQAIGGIKSFADRIGLRDGSSGTELAISPSADTNTGLWFPAPDTINVVTGGTLRAAMSATGQFSLSGVSSLSMPTNTLFSIGASTVYEQAAGILNWSAKHRLYGVADPAIQIGTGNDSSSSIAFYSTATSDAFAAFTSRTFVYSRNASFNIESSTGVLKLGGNQGLGPTATFLEISGLGGIRGVLGTGASDVAVKAGTTVATASVQAGATLFQISSGLGGTEQAHAQFKASGLTNGFTLLGGGTTGSLAINNSVGVAVTWNGVSTLTLDSGNSVLLGATSVYMRSGAADGAAAVAAYSHSAAAWTNATAKLHSFRNSSTEKACVYANGEFETTLAGAGIILASANGSRWRLTVSNAGALVIAAA
jgi:hypothetical protein